MKIVHVIAWPGLGGSEKYALYLAIEAKRRGHDVSFVFGEEGPLLSRSKEEGFDYHLIEMKSSFNPFLVLKSAIYLKKHLKTQKADIVHVHMLREHSIAVMGRILSGKFKIIRSFHRLDNFDWKIFFIRFVLNIYTDAFIATSEVMKSEMANNGFTKNIFVINNGVPRVGLLKNNRTQAIGFLGRLAPEKGILELVRLWPKDANYLIIGGTGPELKQIKEFIKKDKRHNIKLLGQVDDVAEFFEKISILVLPSRTEVVPLVIAEAFSCGTPVVSFDIPGMRENIGDGGVVVPFGDYKKLLEAINSVIEKFDTYSGSATKIYDNQYDINIMWQKTEHLYQQILNK